MPVDIRVPSVGESITEGTLSRWFKKDGETIHADEPLFELETEKATTEIVSPTSGVLHIGTSEGEKVTIGAVIGRIEETAGNPKEPSKSPAPTAPPKTDGKQSQPTLMPAAKRLAEEKHVETAEIAGTGRDGRITKEDVAARIAELGTRSDEPKEAAARITEGTVGGERPASQSTPESVKPTAQPTVPAPRSESRTRMSSIRQRIAERLVASQQSTASLTTFNEADMSAVMALRTKYKEKFQQKHGISLGFMGFFVRAAIQALKAFPSVNSRIDGTDIIQPNYYDIGVAVSTERGLMVPVLRDADRLSFADIEKAIAELASKARDGKITVTDLQGGTFTITNGGVFGSMLSTPILNSPQSAILGMHAIQKRPVAVNDQVMIRPMMYLALSYDHRLIDGREAVLFLVRIKECIEDPERLLLEV
jgi:2-oxoglutarate dehydrogenase E2 component (dihydrolipoamide succinyltransferase)